MIPRRGKGYLQRLRIQKSLIVGPGAPSDPNPIIDTGCPRRVGGIESAIALCQALGIPFELEDLDCKPFYHGYGMHYSEAKITIGIWRLSIADLLGIATKIQFYIFEGSGYLLLGNDIVQNARLLIDENLLIIDEVKQKF